jgi:hypothetical protein
VRLTTTAGPWKSPIRPIAKRNQPSSAMEGWVSGVQTTPARMSRERGPWTATLQSWSVEFRTHAFSPRLEACSRSQAPEASLPPIQRKLFSPRRNTVPSSIIPPCS